MADETRRQRRDARRAAGEQPSADGRGVQQPVPQPAGAGGGGGGAPVAVEHERRRGGFIAESIAELKKVDWPNRAQTIQGTVVVIIAVLIVGAYLWGIDQVIRPLVRHVLLGQ